MGYVLSQTFFSADAPLVAERLLGMVLVRKRQNGETRCRITETEAYDGPHDLACHASRGKTKRNEVMFGPAGYWYVYRCYGIHLMLNIVTGPEGYPAAVLIRGVEGQSGPGRLTRSLNILQQHNGSRAAHETGLWIERGVRPTGAFVQRMPRVGVAYAKEWAEKPWRYVLRSGSVL